MPNNTQDTYPKPLSEMTDAEAVAAGHIKITRVGSIEELLRRPVRWAYGTGRPPTEREGVA